VAEDDGDTPDRLALSGHNPDLSGLRLPQSPVVATIGHNNPGRARDVTPAVPRRADLTLQARPADRVLTRPR
jgi:hypothetical protein